MSVQRVCPSVVVIGGGVFGLTAALELTRRGWRVHVMDAARLPAAHAASTDISKVVRPDYGADELYVEMAEAALAGWERWNTEWPRPLYHEDGFLVLSTTTMDPGGYEHDSFMLLRRRGHPVERLEPRTRGKRFPAWSIETYADGYLNRRAGWVESGEVIARLASEARNAGVQVLEQVSFDQLLDKDGSMVGVRTTEGVELRADIVLVSAGAWTPVLLPDLQNVTWTTGQPVVHFRVRKPDAWRAPHFPVWAADIARTGWYGFPAQRNGVLKIGHHGAGRRVHPDAPRTIGVAEEVRFRNFLKQNIPALADAPIVSMRLCLYCDTFDGNFWIDHHPYRPGLVVAAGDSGHAFKFAPVLGPLIADVVERKQNRWAQRFAWRERLHDGKEAARAGV